MSPGNTCQTSAAERIQEGGVGGGFVRKQEKNQRMTRKKKGKNKVMKDWKKKAREGGKVGRWEGGRKVRRKDRSKKERRNTIKIKNLKKSGGKQDIAIKTSYKWQNTASNHVSISIETVKTMTCHLYLVMDSEA